MQAMDYVNNAIISVHHALGLTIMIAQNAYQDFTTIELFVIILVQIVFGQIQQ